MLLSNSRLGTPRLLEGSSGYLPPSFSTGSSLEEASREPESHRVLLSPLYCSTGITGALRLLWGGGVSSSGACARPTHPSLAAHLPSTPSQCKAPSVSESSGLLGLKNLLIPQFLKMIKANLCILVPVTGGEGCLFKIESCYLKQFLSLISYHLFLLEIMSVRFLRVIKSTWL